MKSPTRYRLGAIIAVTVSLTFWAILIAVAHAGTYLRPPLRYQGDATVTVHFQSRRATQALCAIIKADPRSDACAIGRDIYMPNPCAEPGVYAELFCHEMAHTNGYPAEHPIG